MSKWQYVYDVSWGASKDDGKVSFYEVYRNNIALGSTSGPITKLTDSSQLDSGVKYTYMVKAVDDKGLRSRPSNVSVTPACFLIWCW